ncbi:MAG: bifunctional sugar-1-phosphate nucleotidylyltransferase/acetyltransferase [archaeon]
MIQAVLLAAGKSTRTYPLTLTRPKPLLTVCNKTIIEHNLEQLNGIADEVIIVVNYLKEQIIEKIGNKYKSIKIKYVTQDEPLGTGHALMAAKEHLKGKFIVMNGDDFFSKSDIKKCLLYEYCVLCKELDNTSGFGVIEEEKGIFKKIYEKTELSDSRLVNTGLYVFDKNIFENNLVKSVRGEYEIIDYLNILTSQNKKVYCEKVKDYWIPIVYPWNLLDANSFFLKKMKKKSAKGYTSINGNIVIEKGTKILPGVITEGNIMIGENCKIGPNCYLRDGTTIGNNCHIGQAVEIKNSIIGNNSKVPHLSYVGDSVIGENVNLGAGTITANLRHDNSNVKSVIKGALIDSKRRKLGTIIGDNVHTGIHTSIYPGRKIWPNMSTKPGEIVNKDIQ